MLDIKYIRENPKEIEKNCLNRNNSCDIDKLLDLDKKRLNLIQSVDSLRNSMNAPKGKPTAKELSDLKVIKTKEKKLSEQLAKVEEELKSILYLIPNLTDPETPIGKDESENVVIKKVGKIPEFKFEPKEHHELGEALDLIDITRAAKVTGSRFNFLKGDLVLLEFAIMQFAFSILTDKKILHKIAMDNNLVVSDKPFIPVLPPVMIRPEIMNRMGRLDTEEMYSLERDNLNLIGSAEHTLGAMYADEIIDGAELPIRMVGFSTAFRREAGSYSKDMKGILRVHQFDKLEMESFTTPEDSRVEQDFIVAIQEYLMSQLELPYQVVNICTGDMGRPDIRQIDIETWMPGQNKYRETHTSDLIGDYQARRLNTKFRSESGQLELVHMNDATAFSQRPLIAIMENYQQADGSITVPKVLQKWIGKKVISRK